MKAVVIDDFRLARLETLSLLHTHKEIAIVGEADNGDDALQLILKTKPDIVFTDINMPGMSVFELLEKIDDTIQVVFTTAYEQYAVKTFCFNTVDYLLKPVTQERFDIAIEKIKERRLNNTTKVVPHMLEEDSKIMVNYKKDFILKPVSSILRIESNGNDSKITFEDFVSEMSRPISRIEERLPNSLFHRISRQAIVNIHFVEAIISDTTKSGYEVAMSDGSTLPITRRQLSMLRSQLSI